MSFLRLVAALGLAGVVAGDLTCTPSLDARVDCHVDGEDPCKSAGCCWSPVDPNPKNSPWCFKPDGLAPAPTPAPPAPPAGKCSVSAMDKVDCKKGGEASCNAAACCWQPVDPNPDNDPWCFHQAGTIKTCTLKSVPKAPFSDEEVSQVRRYFEANLDIQGSGMVVAAPDHNTGPGGDYYYAWMRDGALSMNALLQTSDGIQDIKQKMDDWLAWVERSTKQEDPNGSDIMAEPKFTIPGGKPFTGGWCRPQNDGPGLRAITAMAYANVGGADKQRVWNIVKGELDWVAANYMSVGCDLWEEVRSTDFFWNRYTMRMALIQGGAFATSVGKDQQRASTYTKTAKTIESALKEHVESSGYVFESTNRKVDTAVIEAFNVADMNDGVFAPLSKEVVQTLHGLTHYFCNAFELNQKAANAGTPGVLYGRYSGDSYAGGNPWVLLTASAATLLYRQSEALAKGATLTPDAEATLKGMLDQNVSAANLLGAGDSILNRMKTFLTNGMHMNEQIDRNDGHLLSAKDLTWNYANVLKAMKARKAAAGAMSEVVQLV